MYLLGIKNVHLIFNNFSVLLFRSGLGTSTNAEGQEYFKSLEKHCKTFYVDDMADNAIDKVFNRARAADRKVWLNTVFDKNVFLDPLQKRVSYSEFIDKELVHFSHADNVRSIPSVVDGLKPSQRKVLYGCFKKKLVSEIKVVQLAGYIAEQTAYHHGEASLHMTIVAMAQDFVGSNNAPLLMPMGQFGTRNEGGRDFASPRYIFTQLSPITRSLFPEEDDVLLEHQEEDGISVEPKYFVPIVPTLLLNGCQGIGTGWSTYVPPHRLSDIILRVENKVRTWAARNKTTTVQVRENHRYASNLDIEEEEEEEDRVDQLVPWIAGFQGDVYMDSLFKSFTTVGRATRINNTTIEVSELPVGKWTVDYKEYLIKLCELGVIKNFVENHTCDRVNFRITATADKIDQLVDDPEQIIQELKLTSSFSLENMHAFDSYNVIRKYSSTSDIIDSHFNVRLQLYQKRRTHLIKAAIASEAFARNKARFVDEILSGKLSLFSTVNNQIKSKILKALSSDDMAASLRKNGFQTFSEIYCELGENVLDGPLTAQEKIGLEGGESDSNVEPVSDLPVAKKSSNSGFEYLLSMPIQSLTEEVVFKLKNQASAARMTLLDIQRCSEADLWLQDLEKLKKEVYRLYPSSN